MGTSYLERLFHYLPVSRMKAWAFDSNDGSGRVVVVLLKSVGFLLLSGKTQN